jgi:hypothetical protein
MRAQQRTAQRQTRVLLVTNERANDETCDVAWIDNLIVYGATEPSRSLSELRLRVTDVTKAASLHGVDITWVPETQTWEISGATGIEISATATIDAGPVENAVAEAVAALDAAEARDRNVN